MNLRNLAGILFVLGFITVTCLGGGESTDIRYNLVAGIIGLGMMATSSAIYNYLDERQQRRSYQRRWPSYSRDYAE